MGQQFVSGKVYRRPAGGETWCVQALDEIARTFRHPIRIALQMTDGGNHVGHLEKVEGGLVTMDLPRENQAITLPGDKVIAFSLVPDESPESTD